MRLHSAIVKSNREPWIPRSLHEVCTSFAQVPQPRQSHTSKQQDHPATDSNKESRTLQNGQELHGSRVLVRKAEAFEARSRRARVPRQRHGPPRGVEAKQLLWELASLVLRCKRPRSASTLGKEPSAPSTSTQLIQNVKVE